MKLTKSKTIRISEEQHKTLVKMKLLKVDVGNFIREAIREKIKKEYYYILQEKPQPLTNFERQLQKRNICKNPII